MPILQVIEDVFRNPSIAFNPQRHSLKAWAMYCLRDRGFKLINAQVADFAIDSRGEEKLEFKVTETLPDAIDDRYGWLVVDTATSQVQVIPPTRLSES
ncbi:hypothetical protein DO97_12870 [Neosynechococcus sphagnicola sy1]|uniref:Uncharacterized protein n=1 Tax=Neosynechococcus sphagnicola sy1 TaxID=1497020 RepID=A0A098TN32_9CYAN|nr:hypothetical protein [Neosynechococcus sphagnicola]KGF73704.1 hypothetical protein DO97_12870 [Neosynechococcus sphagnicola sy1]